MNESDLDTDAIASPPTLGGGGVGEVRVKSKRSKDERTGGWVGKKRVKSRTGQDEGGEEAIGQERIISNKGEKAEGGGGGKVEKTIKQQKYRKVLSGTNPRTGKTYSYRGFKLKVSLHSVMEKHTIRDYAADAADLRQKVTKEEQNDIESDLRARYSALAALKDKKKEKKPKADRLPSPSNRQYETKTKAGATDFTTTSSARKRKRGKQKDIGGEVPKNTKQQKSGQTARSKPPRKRNSVLIDSDDGDEKNLSAEHKGERVASAPTPTRAKSVISGSEDDKDDQDSSPPSSPHPEWRRADKQSKDK